MKNLVRISLLIMAILLLFCFASCGDDNNPTVTEKVTVEFDIGRRAEFEDEDFEGELKIIKGSALEAFPNAIKEGYVLEGWYLDEDFEEKCTLDYKFEKDTVLYANWTEYVPPQTFTVKFDTSRAGGTPAKIPNQLVVDGGKVTAPDYVPTKKGYVFFGWCVSGDKSKVWNFETSTVTSNITLVAVFVADGDAGNENTCEHNFEIEEVIEPTCQAAGKITRRCTICRLQERLGPNEDPSLAKKEHLTLEEVVEPTCAVDGYIRIYCPNGCGMESTFIQKATGDHEYDDINWTTVIQPTKYVAGSYENPCIKCNGSPLKQVAYYTATDEELAKPQISYLYTGGSYVNEKFVNVATHGRVEVSSYYTVANGVRINDGDTLTAWNADTYVDGANYTADWFTLDFMVNYEIGAFRFVLPNYTAWELGEGCYVSYDLEYWDSEKNDWVYIGEISDKNAQSIGINCQLMLELDSPIVTNKIRAKVTHAGRYTPASVYEIEVFAKTQKTQRLPVSVNQEATYAISGKFNEWVNGADAISDKNSGTFWTSDARYNSAPWATIEFATEKFISAVQISTKATQGRRLKLEIMENGEWVTVAGKLEVPASGQLTQGVIQNSGGVCTFNVDIEKATTKIRVTIINEPEYWNSIIYDITPYSIVEKSYGELETMECKHANPLKGETVAPTCDATGYTIMKCACGFEIKSLATDILGHDFGKYVIDTPATATTIGTKKATCRVDGCGATTTLTYEENYDLPVFTPYLHNAPAAWAQTLDDGNYVEAYTWGNEFFAKYGARATVMMSITYSDALVSIWQEHFEKGIFDLGSHSYNHTTIYSSAVSESALYDEVIKAQYWFRHNFRRQVVLGFAAPLGETSVGVAEYLTGPFAANRNGGDTGIFYNTINQLNARKVWGDLNSYISKADQTEGIYLFVNKKGGSFVISSTTEDGKNIYTWDDKASASTVVLNNIYGDYVTVNKSDLKNYIFSWDEMTFVENEATGNGSYRYFDNDYRYEYFETGSYNYSDGKYEFVDDNSGDFKLVKVTISEYEKAIDKLVSVGGFTVECLHTIAQSSGVIYTKYQPTVSKLEYLNKQGLWAASYNDLVQYLKETLNATIGMLERTDSIIRLNVTDNLDDYMYNHAVTVKVDIPDSWTTVTATQNGKEIPLVDMTEYKKTKNMANISCAIEDGYLYIDVIPDGGEIVITAGEKNDGVNDYEDRVTVTFEPGEGLLSSLEYEANVVAGNALAKMPTPERYGFDFTGWYLDADCTQKAEDGMVFTENTTLYAGWNELPLCSDGTYNHVWDNKWIPSTDGVSEICSCKNCDATLSREIPKAENAE